MQDHRQKTLENEKFPTYKAKHASRKYLFFSHQIFRYRQNTGKKPCSVLMGLQSLNLSLESIGLGEQFLHSLKGSGGAKARFFQTFFAHFLCLFFPVPFVFFQHMLSSEDLKLKRPTLTKRNRERTAVREGSWSGLGSEKQ